MSTFPPLSAQKKNLAKQCRNLGAYWPFRNMCVLAIVYTSSALSRPSESEIGQSKISVLVLKRMSQATMPLRSTLSSSFPLSTRAAVRLHRGTKLKCGGLAAPRYLFIQIRPMQLPFSLSYLIFTPRHVRLPGEVQPIRDKATSYEALFCPRNQG